MIRETPGGQSPALCPPGPLPDTVFTIGYQGRLQPELLDRLVAERIAMIVDVRAVPMSRKPGFSKRLLAASALEAGIGYLHFPALGTPKSGRIAARAGRIAEMEAIFASHLAGEPAQDALREAAGLGCASRICLLCFEADPACCHRRLVAAGIAAQTGQVIVHL